MIVTIDGPAGSGKSVVARRVAKELHFVFFDTGAMYRAITWLILRNKIALSDEISLKNLLDEFSLEIREDSVHNKQYFVQGEEITTAIRTPDVTSRVSEVSALPLVRQKLVLLQRQLAKGKDAVFEGRDMGSVVFPKATLKIFLTAKPEVRARRRWKEMGEKERPEAILEQMQQRDHYDSSRALAPLKKPKGAYVIDSTDRSIQEVVDRIITFVRKIRSKKKPMKIFYRTVIFLTRCFFLLLYRHRVYGLEHFKEGGALIAANHASFLDPPAVSISCPEEVHFLARSSLFTVPLLGKVIHTLNSHAIARNSSDITTFKQVASLVREGKKVLLFPEGTRSKTGEVSTIQRGVGFTAIWAQCSIIPSYVRGTFSIWGRNQKWPKLWGKTQVVFGSPIDLQDFFSIDDKKQKSEAIAQELEKRLKALRQWCEKGFIGTPP